jgi:transposase
VVLGEIEGDPDSVQRLMAKLEKRNVRLHFCYEAGPTGYGLYRRLTNWDTYVRSSRPR